MFADITSWWQQVAFFEKTLWVIAISFSLLFLLQSVLSLVSGHDGMHDASGHADASVEHDQGISYQFFTIKNCIAFFTMFGWVSIAAYNGGLNKSLSILLGVSGGVVMVFIMAVLFNSVTKLRESGTLQMKNAINQVGTVYLFIPSQRKGPGKVHVQVQGTLRELDAVTDDATDIATGKIVKVMALIDDELLLVTAAI